jgi:hypothetical protein
VVPSALGLDHAEEVFEAFGVAFDRQGQRPAVGGNRIVQRAMAHLLVVVGDETLVCSILNFEAKASL